MDSTLIAGIIGAVATIISGFAGVLMGKRQESGVEETLETMIHAALVINQKRVLELEKRLSELEDVPRLEQSSEARFFQANRELLEANLEPLRKVETAARSPLSRADLTIAVEKEMLVLVVQKDEPRPVFNLETTFTNNSHQVSIVDSLEAILKGPGDIDFKFQWRLFFRIDRGGELHLKTSYVHPLVLPSRGSLQLGIQFVGSDFGRENLYSWPTGTYQLEIRGWINRQPSHGAQNLSVCFFFNISEMDIARLKRWIGWGDAEWAQFPRADQPDPDQAAGHPVRLMRA